MKKKTAEIDRTFGTRLLLARLAKRMSQKQAAAKLGVTQQTVCGWETGAAAPSVAMLKIIASAYERHPGWFLEEGDPLQAGG